MFQMQRKSQPVRNAGNGACKVQHLAMSTVRGRQNNV